MWIWKARKAGWLVSVESSSADEPGDECGVVDVEGLKYRINFSPRVRRRVFHSAPGQHAIATAIEIATGESAPAAWGWEFAPAVWAEPIVEDD
ncbi:hypothetical protein ACLMAL_19820 [Nocardia sp. CWNU-33]|uniref:hypothetical protein n=1 Tax=Nocardia sp. CWNU-33 TaxID=3392117 RepID=UPI00398EBA15